MFAGQAEEMESMPPQPQSPSISDVSKEAAEAEPAAPAPGNTEIESAKTMDKETKMFKPIDGETSAEEAIEVESLCVNCGENVSLILI